MRGMKNKGEVTLIVLVVVIVAAATGLIYSEYTKRDDTQVEEISEQVIESQTGLNIDLTPKSPEAKAAAKAEALRQAGD